MLLLKMSYSRVFGTELMRGSGVLVCAAALYLVLAPSLTCHFAAVIRWSLLFLRLYLCALGYNHVGH